MLPQRYFLHRTRNAHPFGYTTAMRGVVWLLMCCLCALPLWAARWVPHAVPGAVIYARPGDDAAAQQLGAMAEREMTRLMTELGIKRAGPFPVYIYTSRVDFLRDTGNQLMLRGVSYRPTGIIRLDAAGIDAPVRQVLAHELTHSLLTQHLGDNVGSLPIWVNEGIAGHYSDPITRDELPNASRIVYRTGVLSLNDMESTFAHGEVRDGAYLQSRSMVAWLEYRKAGSIRRLVAALAAGEDFNTALYDAAKLTPKQWLQRWDNDIPEFNKWLTFILYSPVTYAPFAILVLIAAFVRIRQRIRERRERDAELLREEEAQEAALLEAARQEAVNLDAPTRPPMFRGYGDEGPGTRVTQGEIE